MFLPMSDMVCIVVFHCSIDIKNSFLNKILGNAKGVIVPHALVKNMGDIMIVSKAAVPNYNPEDVHEGGE